MKLILGSGIIGSAAKILLGDDWQLMPMKRSRYFTFETPYADDFIAVSDEITDFVKSFGCPQHVDILKRPFSFGGELLYDSPVALEEYLTKVYGQDYPTIFKHAIKNVVTVYPISAKVVHDKCQTLVRPAIDQGVVTFGRDIKTISPHHLVTDKGEWDFDILISTIPLNAMLRYMGTTMELVAKDVFYYHIRTKSVNLEGARQALVADKELLFFKVNQIGPVDYQFWTTNLIDNPLFYFGGVIGYDFEIVEVMRIEEALPLGDIPDLGFLKEYGIKTIGSNAEWNDLIDIGTCFKRIVKIKTGSNNNGLLRPPSFS